MIKIGKRFSSPTTSTRNQSTVDPASLSSKTRSFSFLSSSSASSSSSSRSSSMPSYSRRSTRTSTHTWNNNSNNNSIMHKPSSSSSRRQRRQLQQRLQVVVEERPLERRLQSNNSNNSNNNNTSSISHRYRHGRSRIRHGSIFVTTTSTSTTSSTSRKAIVTTTPTFHPSTSIVLVLMMCWMSLWMKLDSTTILTTVVSAQQYCNICPDVANTNGAVPSYNHHTIVETLSGYITCLQLAEEVADVPSDGTGHGLETFHCAYAQFRACVAGCCDAPGSPDLGDGHCYGDVYDPHPSCDICGDLDYNNGTIIKRELPYVPDTNAFKTTSNGPVGRHNCKGLYHAASEGIFTANLCNNMKEAYGGDCCNL